MRNHAQVERGVSTPSPMKRFFSKIAAANSDQLTNAINHFSANAHEEPPTMHQKQAQARVLTKHAGDSDRATRSKLRTKTLRPEMAVLARIPKRSTLGPPGPSDFIGAPLRFVYEPEHFDKVFRRVAQPYLGSLRSAGFLTMETMNTNALAWTVRHHKTNVYIAALRRISCGWDGLRQYARFEDQPNGVEQVTFRVQQDIWAEYGASIAADLEQWVLMTRKAPDDHFWYEEISAPEVELEPGSNVENASTETSVLHGLTFSDSTPTRVMSASQLRATSRGNHSSFVCLVQQLSCEQRRTAVLATGFRVRFSGVGIQVFDTPEFKLTCSGDLVNEQRYFAIRERLMRRESAGREHWSSTVDTLLASPAACHIPNAEFARELVFDTVIGVRHSLAAYDQNTLFGCIALFDAATDIRLGRGQEVTKLQSVHESFILSLITSPIEAKELLWAEIAAREFAPAIVARLALRTNSPSADATIIELCKLRSTAPRVFEALSRRMAPEDFVRPMLWHDIIDTAESRLSVQQPWLNPNASVFAVQNGF